MGWKLPSILVTTLVALSAVTTASGKPWTLVHLPGGKPDMQGYWTNGALTPLERPAEFAGKEFFTPAEAEALREKARRRVQQSAQKQHSL